MTILGAIGRARLIQLQSFVPQGSARILIKLETD
jgi:hypothetical protein